MQGDEFRPSARWQKLEHFAFNQELPDHDIIWSNWRTGCPGYSAERAGRI